jgi:hypothetical protein
MLDTIVAMPDVVVTIVTAKKLTEKGLPIYYLLFFSHQEYKVIFILLVFSIILLKETKQRPIVYPSGIIRKKKGRGFWAIFPI